MIKIDLNPEESQLRQFGWITLFGFPLATLGVTSLLGYGTDRATTNALYYGLPAGAVTLLASFVSLALTRLIYIGLMVVAAPIGFVLSWVLMTTMYYLFVTPVGLIFRLLGKDPLDKLPDPNVQSYWHVRTKERTPASYFKMF